MYFVTQEYNTLYEIKKSKFYAYIIPYHLFEITLKKLQAQHPKARHFVYAYRYLNEFDQIVENSSDDGEPKGTSGKPSLTVLAGADIINSAVIIVRYFGGIKLGTGGLVRAYGNSVKDVLNIATLVTYTKQIQKQLTLDYQQLSQIEYLLNNLNIEIVNKQFNETVTLIIKGAKQNIDQLVPKLARDIKMEDIA